MLWMLQIAYMRSWNQFSEVLGIQMSFRSILVSITGYSPTLPPIRGTWWSTHEPYTVLDWLCKHRYTFCTYTYLLLPSTNTAIITAMRGILNDGTYFKPLWQQNLLVMLAYFESSCARKLWQRERAWQFFFFFFLAAIWLKDGELAM